MVSIRFPVDGRSHSTAGARELLTRVPFDPRRRHTMSAHVSGAPQGDVVAAFDDQTSANDAIYHLRLAGFGEDRIACYSRPPGLGLTEAFNRDYAFAGVIVGGAVGVAIGELLAPLVNQWSLATRNVDESFGLSAVLTIILALVCGLIGWRSEERRVGKECSSR